MFRIVQTSPSEFQIEKRGLFGWSVLGDTDAIGVFFPYTFPSVESAQDRVDRLMFRPRVVA